MNGGFSLFDSDFNKTSRSCSSEQLPRTQPLSVTNALSHQKVLNHPARPGENLNDRNRSRHQKYFAPYIANSRNNIWESSGGKRD